MATQGENEKLERLGDRMTKVEVRIDEVIVPILTKVDKFVDDNKSGIRTASLLDNKIVTVVIGGIVLAGLILLAKGGGI